MPLVIARGGRDDRAMPPLPTARQGATLEVKKRLLPFSFFPVTRGNRRYSLFDAVFAVSPWAVMRGAINDRVSSVRQREEALAFLEQAEDFYVAATGRLAANPLLLYYSFLNLGKAVLRTLGATASFDRAAHGLFERRGAGDLLKDAEVVVSDSGPNRLDIFPTLVEQLGFPRPPSGTAYPVGELMPQIVVGHRLWREADRGNQERFVAINEIEIVDDRAAREVWLRLFIERGDVARYDITRSRLLDEGALRNAFHEVKVTGTGRADHVFVLELRNPIGYGHRPTDELMQLVELMRPLLWRIAISIPETTYRKYYVHLTPPNEASRLPQLASLWALFFYFGSIVRYRPHHFDAISAGPYGPFVTEFISAQPEQMLYLLASEMREREIAKPAII